MNEYGEFVDKYEFICFIDNMGFFDGMIVDSEDYFWVVVWNGYGIYCFVLSGE